MTTAHVSNAPLPPCTLPSLQLPLHCVRKPEFWPDYHPSCQLPSAPVPTEDVDYPVNSLVQVSAEHVVLGKDIDYPGYGWDNEYGRRDIDVSAFRCVVLPMLLSHPDSVDGYGPGSYLDMQLRMAGAVMAAASMHAIWVCCIWVTLLWAQHAVARLAAAWLSRIPASQRA